MTRKHLIAVAGLIVIAATGYYLLARPGLVQTPVQIVNTGKAVTVDRATSDDVVENDKGNAALPAANGSLDREEITTSEAHGSTTNKPAKMEKVLGIWVKEDRNCTVKIALYRTAEDGTQTPVYSCVPNEPRERDIYTTYATEELKVLAYSDAHAAHVLAIRLREKNFSQAVKYAVRATALSGEGKHIGMMLNLIPSKRVDNKQDELAYFEHSYVLSGVATTFDEIPSEMHAYWANKAADYQKEGIDMDALDARIVSLLGQINSIREEVGIN